MRYGNKAAMIRYYAGYLWSLVNQNQILLEEIKILNNLTWTEKYTDHATGAIRASWRKQEDSSLRGLVICLW